jgi:flagellar basal-body rod protein FlgB
MRTSLDSYLGIHPQALTLEAQRNELLAANLANVDTPGFKARDLDFKAALAAAAGGSTLTNAAPLALRAPDSAGPAALVSNGVAGAAGAAGAPGVDSAAGSDGVASAALKYRIPMTSSLDGNTVDEQLEQSAFAENSVRYQATLTFLNGKLRDLMTAITGS